MVDISPSLQQPPDQTQMTVLENESKKVTTEVPPPKKRIVVEHEMHPHFLERNDTKRKVMNRSCHRPHQPPKQNQCLHWSNYPP